MNRRPPASAAESSCYASVMEMHLLSVIAPARNEQGNIGPLVRELTDVLDPLPGTWELIIVDDASTDTTLDELRKLAKLEPRLRVLRLPADARGRGYGQTAAFAAGLRAARGDIVAMLDADAQNDPADLPPLINQLFGTEVDLVQGDRTASRCDGWVRAASSVVGRLARRMIIGDPVRDTGCSLRVMRRPVADSLPLHLRGMHRFIPALALQRGFRVAEAPVSHRPRRFGRTKYGIRNRAMVGLIDCFAVRWMKRRLCVPMAEELDCDALAVTHVPDTVMEVKETIA